MGKKIKHIRVRITEAQFRWLADILTEEQRNKSEIIRDALNKYLVENVNWNKRKDNEPNIG